LWIEKIFGFASGRSPLLNNCQTDLYLNSNGYVAEEIREKWPLTDESCDWPLKINTKCFFSKDRQIGATTKFDLSLNLSIEKISEYLFIDKILKDIDEYRLINN
jgi:hypothetical protein